MGIFKRIIARAETFKSVGEVGGTVWGFISPYASAWVLAAYALGVGAMTWFASTSEWFWTTWGPFGVVAVFAILCVVLSIPIGIHALWMKHSNARSNAANTNDGLSYDLIFRQGIWYLVFYNDGPDTDLLANIDLRILPTEWQSAPGRIVHGAWQLTPGGSDTTKVLRRRSVEMPLLSYSNSAEVSSMMIYFHANNALGITRGPNWHIGSFSQGYAPGGRIVLNLTSSAKPKREYRIEMEYSGFAFMVISSAIPLRPRPLTPVA